MPATSKPRLPRSVVVLGKRWRLKFGRVGDGAVGLCDPPDAAEKTITISSTLTGSDMLETVIHELLHAAQWHLDEEYVERISHDIAEVLWRLGYRRDA